MTTHNRERQRCRLATVSALPETDGYEWLSVPALRHLIFQAESRRDSRGRTIPGNGLAEAGAIIRLGRKVLIDVDRFDTWLNAHRVPTMNDREGG